MNIESKKGLSLVESMIAMVILIVVLTGSIAFYHLSSSYAREGLHKQIALKLAHSRIENLRNSDYNTLNVGTTASTITVGNIAITETVIITQINPGGGVNNYKQVAVNETWTEAGKTNSQNIQLTTLIAS